MDSINSPKQRGGHRKSVTLESVPSGVVSAFEIHSRKKKSIATGYLKRESWTDSSSTRMVNSMVLVRLKKIKESFKIFARRAEMERAASAPHNYRFRKDCPKNPRYFLSRVASESRANKREYVPAPGGPIIKKMNITHRSQRTSCVNTENMEKRAFDLNESSKPNNTLSRDILEDLEWCIGQIENVTSSKYDLANDRLRQTMDAELANLEKSRINSDVNLAAYLKNYMGYDKKMSVVQTLPSLNTAALQTQEDIIETDEKVKDREINNEITLSRTSSYCADIMLRHTLHPFVKEDFVETLANRNKWGLDVFKVAEVTSYRPLTSTVFTILHDWNFLGKFSISRETLCHNLSMVEGLYKEHLPYHNSLHGTDVFCSAHVILSCTALENIFTDIEIFAALYAAATHDVGHPGFTNNYMIMSKSKVAALYKDVSVLENFHIKQTLRIINTDKCNILAKWKARDVRLFKKILTAVILATDYAHHMTLLTDIKVVAESCQADPGDSSTVVVLDNFSEKLQLLQAIVHCCDISNPLKPLNQYQKWVSRIMTEFFRQGDLEKGRGINPSPMCDRSITDIPKGQCGFIDYVVKPIWDTLAIIIHPEADEMIAIMEKNRAFYQEHHIPQEEALNMRFSDFSSKPDAEADLDPNFGILED